MNPPVSPWLARPQPNPDARQRIFCFPYAGAGAIIYRLWPAHLPGVEVVAVQPPGREARMREAPITNVGALAAAVCAALPDWLDRPFAFYGHSLGALVAYECARQLAQAGSPQPAHLFVGSRRAPHLPNPHPPIHTLPDDTFIAQVQMRYGGIPDIIRSDAELMALFTPTLRADFTALETYICPCESPLASPITVFGGSSDSSLTAGDLLAWQQHTRGAFSLQMIPGGHFFLQEARPTLLAWIAGQLNDGATRT